MLFFYRHSTSFPGFSPMRVGENLGTRLAVSELYFLIMQYFLTFYFRALEAKLYQEKEEQKSKAAK